MTDKVTSNLVVTQKAPDITAADKSIIIGLAYIRALAAALVVVTHLSGAYFMTPSENWDASNFFGSFSRVCVPMFLMLTGALFLKREEPLKYYYGKRLIRIALPLVFWSVFWLAWLSQSGNAPSNWALAIIKGPVIFHMWYFYLLLSMSLGMPVFVKFYVNSEPREVWSVILVWFFFCSLLPVIDPGHHVYGSDQAGVTNVINYSGYFLLGAALADLKISRFRAILLGGGLFAFGGGMTVILTSWLTTKTGHASDFYYYYTSPAVVLASVGIFLAIVNCKRGPKPLHLVLMVLSECSLGVYCLHILTLDRLRAAFGIIGGPENAWIMIPVNAVLILLITVPVIYCMRLIKPLRSVA